MSYNMLRKYFKPVMAPTLCLVNTGVEEKIKIVTFHFGVLT